MSEAPVHPNPRTHPPATDHPDNDPTYRSDVNWGSFKMVAYSGVGVRYGGPSSSREPVNGPTKGIGIWKRHTHNYRSWDGLLELPLHLIVTRWVISRVTFGLRLPIMGMPPRPPSSHLLDHARDGTVPFSPYDWFRYATVIPARLFAEFVNIDPKTATMELRGSWRGYNYSTAFPEEDLHGDDVNENEKSMENLYYIQLLRNELPSYHFWSRTDPIGNGGEMRHGLIAKGATACYDIEGDDMINNVCTNFSRLQNLPLRDTDAVDSEQITYAEPDHNRRSRNRDRSTSPRDSKLPTVYRKRREEDPSRVRRTRPRNLPDSSYKPRKGEAEEEQEVKLRKRMRKPSVGDRVFKPEVGGKRRTRARRESEEED